SDIVAIWLLNGTSIASSKILGGIASAWEIEQVGDMNKDGKADVVWKNTTTGEVKVWLMNGVNVIGIGSPDTVSIDWDIQP
ncbi:MAG: FG-GAP repeat protein, partial [Nitrospira sp.]|nr:FG-GAP repeat protein [Nitrospira sp.]